jgi:microcystin-dependent protein
MIRSAIVAFTLLWSLLPTFAQGTIPIVLTQQFSFSGCTTTGAVCGTPLSGGLLYTYQAGTVATPQTSYQDTALTIPNPFPLVLDANGRVPVFYLADGTIHVRLTDRTGVVQFDVPNMLVIGPSSGGSSGGTVDPTTILSTGDIKFRATSETLTGFVKANGLTIGNISSGATGRANADTQALYVYLWQNCSQPTSNRHCVVSGGLGANGLADFNANKALAVFDMRAMTPTGLDDMGAMAAGRLLSSNVTSGGTDGPTTPNATGGEANHTLLTAEMPSHTHVATDAGHVHPFTYSASSSFSVGGASTAVQGIAATGDAFGTGTNTGTANVTNANTGGGGAHNNMEPFILGTWYLKL